MGPAAGRRRVGLGLAPLAAAGPATARGARRAVEALLLLACIVLFVAPELHPAVVGAGPDVRAEVETGTPWPFVFWLVVVALATLSGRGVLLPEPDRLLPGPDRLLPEPNRAPGPS